MRKVNSRCEDVERDHVGLLGASMGFRKWPAGVDAVVPRWQGWGVFVFFTCVFTTYRAMLCFNRESTEQQKSGISTAQVFHTECRPPRALLFSSSEVRKNDPPPTTKTIFLPFFLPSFPNVVLVLCFVFYFVVCIVNWHHHTIHRPDENLRFRSLEAGLKADLKLAAEERSVLRAENEKLHAKVYTIQY